MDAPVTRSPVLLSRDRARLLVVDVQEKLVPAIANAEVVVANCSRLVRAADVLGVESFVTEQYPKGLGGTVSELASQLPEPIEKLRFSSAAAVGWTEENRETESRDQVVVCGIEAHVCVLQTVMDLLAASFQVHVVADAVGSRFQSDRETALNRMRDEGAVVTTTEAVMFELCETAEAAEFKQISAIVRERSK